MTHAHITAWLLGAILFFVALGLHKSGNEKGMKIVHMVLRLFYLLIIVTGVLLVMSVSNIDLLYTLKAAVGVWVIAMMELILIRTKKNQKTSILWIQFAVAFLLVLYLGLSLPLNLNLF